MLHELMRTWFEFVEEWGYLGVFVMMALESTIVPIPSEIIMPPAAYWAAQGRMNIWGVILAGGTGSTFGSSLCYGFTYTVGRAFVQRWGRYFLLPPARLELAERWLAQYAYGGVFLARLLPVVRHLIGFPAGLVRMPFLAFLGITFVGSTLWCAVLAFFGARTIGRSPTLLDDPSELAHVIKDDLLGFVLLVVGLGAGWLFVKWFGSRGRAAPEAS
ncbi:MAG: DedA family protein [Pseudomonadota bacterium]|nr:DedA family protein [Pseudomonadota bacterium]